MQKKKVRVLLQEGRSIEARERKGAEEGTSRLVKSSKERKTANIEVPFWGEEKGKPRNPPHRGKEKGPTYGRRGEGSPTEGAKKGITFLIDQRRNGVLAEKRGKKGYSEKNCC